MSVKLRFKCSKCGSEDVVSDAWAAWDYDKQEWQLSSIFDASFCNACETSLSSLECVEEQVEDA